MTEVLLRDELLALLGGRRVRPGCRRRRLAARAPRDARRAPAVLGLQVRAAAVARLLPDHAVVADRCLLWLLGVDVLPPGPPVLEVVVPRGAVPPRHRDVHARIALLPEGDVARLGPQGLRCLRPARVVADLLRLLPLVEAVVVADAAQHAGVCDADALWRELDAVAGLRNVVRARRALERSDARAESPPQSRLRLALCDAGLTPVPQYVVLDAQGRFVARVDLAVPELRLAIEHDGRAVHEQPGVTDDRRPAERPRRGGLDGLALHGRRPALGAAPAVAQVLALVRAAAA